VSHAGASHTEADDLPAGIDGACIQRHADHIAWVANSGNQAIRVPTNVASKLPAAMKVGIDFICSSTQVGVK
jgi:hypothetical protein